MSQTPERGDVHPSSAPVDRPSQTETLSRALSLDGERRAPCERVAFRTTLLLLVVFTASRFVGVGRSLWWDEVYTVWAYVLRGPETIHAGINYIPNNHILFSWLTWATSEVAGTSEPVLRAWSIVPGIASVVLLAWWAGQRFGWWVAAAAVASTTVSPLHASLVTEARGYGLVLLAATGLLIAGVETAGRPSPAADLWVTLSVLVGTLAIPTFAVPAAATAVVILSVRRGEALLRLGVLAGLTGLVTFVWYRPMLDILIAGRTGVGARAGETVTLFSPLLAPPRLLLGPMLSAALPGLPGGAVGALTGAAVLVGCVVLLRSDALVAGMVAIVPLLTIAVLGAVGFHLLPRYIAFLLPHLTLALAVAVVVGARELRIRFSRPIVLATTGVLLLLSAGGARTTISELRTPLQEFQAVADLVAELRPTSLLLSTTEVGWLFYLRDHDAVVIDDVTELDRRLCEAAPPVVYIEPAIDAPPELPCLQSRGYEQHDYVQRSRPGTMRAWTWD
jgi:hypothetical protein